MSDRYLVTRQGLMMRRLVRVLNERERAERDSIEFSLIAATEHLTDDDMAEQVVDVDVLISELRRRNWHWGIS